MYGRDINNSCNCIQGFIEYKSKCSPKIEKQKVTIALILIAILCTIFVIIVIGLCIYKIKSVKKPSTISKKGNNDLNK